MIDWAMRRLLSLDRDAAKAFFRAPDDGKKWTISALVWWAHLRGLPGADERLRLIDKAFWPGHCREAYEDTLAGRPLELYTWRARRGAVRVLWMLMTGWSVTH